MSRAIIFTDQHAPDGRTIRFNVDEGTRKAAGAVGAALQNGQLLEIPNEAGGEPIFINPERVATISPMKEA